MTRLRDIIDESLQEKLTASIRRSGWWGALSMPMISELYR